MGENIGFRLSETVIKREVENDGFERTTMRESGKVFLHSVNLKDIFAEPLIRQLLNLKRAWTPDYLAHLEQGIREKHHSMRNIDISELRFNAFKYPGAPTPGTGTAVYIASMCRAGFPLNIGAIKSKPLSRERIDYALWKSEIELKFEQVRRLVAPNAVSRLNCFYLADDIEVIKSIPEFDSKAPILKVRIAKRSSIIKADMSWIDAFCDSYRYGDIEHCDEYAKNYWEYYSHKSGTCKWEYLVDGIIEVVGGLDDLRDALDEIDEIA